MTLTPRFLDELRARELRANATDAERRFWNNDVMENIEGVVAKIEQALVDMPSPSPSREREGSFGARGRGEGK